MKTSRTDAPRTARTGLLVLLAALLAGGFALTAREAGATAAQQASPSAVAIVDLAKLLEGLDERAYLEQELNREIEKRQGELDQITGEITRMREDIKLLGENDPDRITRIRDLRLKEVQAQALRQFVQEQLSLEKGKMLGGLFNKVQSSVSEIANRDGWDLVLINDAAIELPQMANEQQMLQLILSRRVLAAGTRVDITDQVRTSMNNRFNAAQP